MIVTSTMKEKFSETHGGAISALYADPPPSYAAEHHHRLSKSPSRSNAINYLSIHRPLGAIHEKFTVDPTLSVPRALLPPLPRGKTERDRKNLSLETTIGEIQADITIIRPYRATDQRVALEVSCRGTGAVTVTVHTPYLIPFTLSVSSTCGSVEVGIPRSFTGVINMASGLGALDLSKELQARVSNVTQAGKRKSCFVGELTAWTDDWQANELTLHTGIGTVAVRYEDEA